MGKNTDNNKLLLYNCLNWNGNYLELSDSRVLGCWFIYCPSVYNRHYDSN